jgi:hypothetical protein
MWRVILFRRPSRTRRREGSLRSGFLREAIGSRLVLLIGACNVSQEVRSGMAIAAVDEKLFRAGQERRINHDAVRDSMCDEQSFRGKAR